MLFETLESRRLFSVTVSEAYPGFYEIHGDNSDNVIEVSVSMADETFTLNNVTYSEVAYIFVYTYGGNNTVTLLSVDGPGSIGASVLAGDGHDVITLNFDGGIWAGGGNDIIYLSDSFRGEVYGGDGNDQIYISGACFEAEIRGGAGDDYIDCSQNLCPVVIRGGAGNDTLIGSPYDDVLYGDEGDNILVGGGGNDTFYHGNGYNQIFEDDWDGWEELNYA